MTRQDRRHGFQRAAEMLALLARDIHETERLEAASGLGLERYLPETEQLPLYAPKEGYE